ncbi:MAG: hypothetical protein AB4426_21515 [Xenococcaceae cyanobacterium]
MLREALTIYNTLSPEKIKTWLEDKKPSEIVGIARSPTLCPLHIYLKEKTGLDVAVGNIRDNDTFQISGGYYLMPEWACNFTEILDHCWWMFKKENSEKEEEDSEENYNKIKASVALSVLKIVTEHRERN